MLTIYSYMDFSERMISGLVCGKLLDSTQTWNTSMLYIVERTQAKLLTRNMNG